LIYLIGSLRNDNIPDIGKQLRDAGHEVFDDWWGAGPEADDCWKSYENRRGRTYREALAGNAAETILTLTEDIWIAALEQCLSILRENPDTWNSDTLSDKESPGTSSCRANLNKTDGTLMLKFATAICYDTKELLEALCPNTSGSVSSAE
jgi:hypothetical protein